MFKEKSESSGNLFPYSVIARRETPQQSVHPKYVIARNRRFRGNLLKGVVPSQDYHVGGMSASS